jgi:endonuclease/exonuclease/phosphatase family metal-dependent hydrolase
MIEDFLNIIRRILIFFLVFLLLTSCNKDERLQKVSNQKEALIGVLAWNIWHGANNENLKEDGRPHAIEIIKELSPDIVLMVETYGSGKMIADSLGYNFHLIAPEDTPEDAKNINLSIMSKFPFGNRFDFYRHFNIGGIEIMLNDTTHINAFSIWLNYQPWVDDPTTLNKTPEELIEWEKSGTRLAELDTILKGLKPFIEKSKQFPLIVGGDFNIWSDLDWQEDTRLIHNDLVVDWWTTSTMAEKGFIDSYREVHPNTNEYPGITWDMADKKDEHRIDFIFYQGDKLEAVESIIIKEPFNKDVIINDKSFMYPSDHGLVYTTFRIN